MKRDLFSLILSYNKPTNKPVSTLLIIIIAVVVVSVDFIEYLLSGRHDEIYLITLSPTDLMRPGCIQVHFLDDHLLKKEFIANNPSLTMKSTNC